MNIPSSPGSGIQRGWTSEARTSIGWNIPLEIYAEIIHTRNKFEQGYYAHCAYLRDIKDLGMQICAFFYDEKILEVGEILESLLYMSSYF